MNYKVMIPNIGNPDVMEIVEHEIPSPADNEVLIRNHATAVNFIDTIIRRGEMPEGMMPELPFTPGVEGAGVVEAVGEGVTSIKAGDRVAWMGALGAGGYATHSLIPEPYVVKVNEKTDFKTASAIPVNAMTAYHMLVNLGHARPGQSVLVHAAAGGVGTMALQIAKHLELTVIGSVSTAKVAYAKEQGADYVIDYRKEDLAAKVMAYTNGRGVDLTLNPVSGESLKTDLEALAPLGTAIIFGFLSGPPEGTFAEDLAQHFGKSVAVRVSDIYTHFAHNRSLFSQDFNTVFKLLEKGIVRPQIDEVIELKNAPEAHVKLEAGKVIGKLVLSID